jgi:excisionase family DNA binding protein
MIYRRIQKDMRRVTIMQRERNTIADIDMNQGQGPARRDSKPRLLAVRHVAELLGIHESTVRMWADTNVLESYRIGPRQDRRIPIESVQRILEVSRQWPHYGPAGRREEKAASPGTDSKQK